MNMVVVDEYSFEYILLGDVVKYGYAYYGNQGKTIIRYVGTDTTFNILEQVTSIGYCAFAVCQSLLYLYIPNNVANIQDCAFLYVMVTYFEREEELETWGESWNNSEEHVVTSYWGISENNFLIADNFHYIIRNNEAMVVRYVGDAPQVTIPSEVLFNNTVYAVKSIGDYAFYNLNTVEKVTIPDCIEKMGDKIFFCCWTLVSIELLSETPPTMEILYYDESNTNKNVKIFVPNVSLDVYKTAEGWRYHASYIYAKTTP